MCVVYIFVLVCMHVRDRTQTNIVTLKHVFIYEIFVSRLSATKHSFIMLTTSTLCTINVKFHYCHKQLRSLLSNITVTTLFIINNNLVFYS